MAPHQQQLDSIPTMLKTHDGKLSAGAIMALLFGVMVFAQVLVIGIYLLIRRVNSVTERNEAVAKGMHMAFLEAVGAEREGLSPISSPLRLPESSSSSSSTSAAVIADDKNGRLPCHLSV